MPEAGLEARNDVVCKPFRLVAPGRRRERGPYLYGSFWTVFLVASKRAPFRTRAMSASWKLPCSASALRCCRLF